jgi:uncharacterized protein (DUF2384 family)
MSSNSESHDMERVAIEALRSLSELWRLSRDEAARLLQVPEDMIARWFEVPDRARLEPSQLERVSYLLGIYGALHSFYGDQQAADDWPRRPNAYFGERMPMDRMLDGIDGIIEVHGYAIQAVVGW